MQVLNFYSTIFADQLKRGRKTATIRLGDKSHKYKKNQAVLVTIGRFYIVESANWLAARGEMLRAEDAVRRLLVRKPQYPAEIKLATRDGQSVGHGEGGGKEKPPEKRVTAPGVPNGQPVKGRLTVPPSAPAPKSGEEKPTVVTNRPSRRIVIMPSEDEPKE